MSRDLALSNIRRRIHGLTILAALVLCAAAWGVRPAVSLAHEVRPASLQITASAPGTYEAIWKQPTVGDMAIHLAPRLSSGALNGAPTSQTAEPGRLIKRWTIVNGAPLEG